MIHGWGGSPEGDWFPWAKEALAKRGYEVYVPEMPETKHPKIKAWLGKLKDTVGEVRPDDIFVGHSIGTSTVLRYLGTLKDRQKIDKAILIAPWQYLTLDEGESEEDAVPWMTSPIDYEKIKTKARRIVAIFSRNDPWVPMKKNLEFFKEKLIPEIVIKEGVGHFTEGEGLTKLPFLLKLIENG